MPDNAVATVPEVDLVTMFGGKSLSPALMILLNDKLYAQCKRMAQDMAESEGITPAHLIKKPAACMAVIEMSLTWKLSPRMVAGATYMTPGNRIGYEGKLCQAIIENSGRIEGTPQFEYFGDWGKILGKFKIQESQRGGKYPIATWKPEDEEGLGIIVRAQVKGESEPREFEMLLKQAFPRNSTLWATDPKTQMGYLAIRRFGNVATPGIFMGIPFDREDVGVDEYANMKDVTPEAEQPKARPTRSSAKAARKAAGEMDAAARAAASPPAGETVVEDAGNDAQESQHEEAGEAVDAKEDSKQVLQETETEDGKAPADPREAEQASASAEAEGGQGGAAPATGSGGDGAPSGGAAGGGASGQAAAEPFNAAEAKQFLADAERRVVRYPADNGIVGFDKLRSDLKPGYKRLKLADPELAKKLNNLIATKYEAVQAADAKKGGRDEMDE